MAKRSDRTPNPTAAPQEVKAPDDPTRREPSDDAKFDARPLSEPSGVKGDLPENPDRNATSETTAPDGTVTRSEASTASVDQPGTVIRDASTGQSREILLPDGTPAGSTPKAPGGGDAVPSWGERNGSVARAEARPNRLPTEDEALKELEANPERSSVLSDKGYVTRDRLKRVVFDVESRNGVAEASVSTEGGNVKVNTSPV